MRKVYKNDLNQVHTLVEKIPNSSLPKDLIIHNLAFDKWSFSLLNKPPYCPDHIIFCGKKIQFFMVKIIIGNTLEKNIVTLLLKILGL